MYVLLSATVVSESAMRLDVSRRLVFLSLQAVSYGGGLIGDWMGASGTYSLSYQCPMTTDTNIDEGWFVCVYVYHTYCA